MHITSSRWQPAGLYIDSGVPLVLPVWKTFRKQIDLAPFVFWLMFLLQIKHSGCVFHSEASYFSPEIAPAYTSLTFRLCDAILDVSNAQLESQIWTFTSHIEIKSFSGDFYWDWAPQCQQQVHVVEMCVFTCSSGEYLTSLFSAFRWWRELE